MSKALPIFEVYSLPEVTSSDTLIGGVDEVGRGCLFGPVFAGAVVFPVCIIPELIELGVRDSKELSPKRRAELAEKIRELATAYHVSFATAQEIDKINILQASLLAMQKAVMRLKVQPAVLLVDGRQKIADLSIRQENLIKGDKRSPIIAAASIIAKVKRDNLIIRLAQKYPEYDLIANKGYGTKKHRDALISYGPCFQHRLSFRPCRVNQD